MLGLPTGFRALPVEGGRAVLRADLAPALRRAGLDRPWELSLRRPSGGASGRGPRAVIPIEGGLEVLVKQCLRGGWIARWNRSWYASPRRFLRELEVGRRAEAAGCPVLPAVGAVLIRAGAGVRAWSMSIYLPRARDLAEATAELPDPEPRERLLEAALRAIDALHRAGLHHRDLNLGNVLVRPGAEAAVFDVRIVDLDRARWLGRPLPPRIANRVVARFERSWCKVLGREGGVPAARRHELYAALLSG
jgi:hypothetical protein